MQKRPHQYKIIIIIINCHSTGDCGVQLLLVKIKKEFLNQYLSLKESSHFFLTHFEIRRKLLCYNLCFPILHFFIDTQNANPKYNTQKLKRIQ